MSMYVMRERLDSEEVEEIIDCLRSIRDKFKSGVEYVASFFKS